MTREEVIQYWEQFDAEIDNIYDTASEEERAVLEEQRKMVEFTISSLRQQETVTNRNGLNEPLTLDDLRKMDGEPVWVQSPGIPEYGRWAIVEGVGENSLFLHDDFTCHDYGKTWLAFRQKPEEDDHA